MNNLLKVSALFFAVALASCESKPATTEGAATTEATTAEATAPATMDTTAMAPATADTTAAAAPATTEVK
ncbi:hypothetical protein [Hymenobacter norwichensis]|uniref:hypothetical protein n=1 Tax=Hymenobacter norwichensis TaxID=223903 RepID=UPI0003B3FA96|nr:hypothetical protein [Hymenobacter norwichensis]